MLNYKLNYKIDFFLVQKHSQASFRIRMYLRVKKKEEKKEIYKEDLEFFVIGQIQAGSGSRIMQTGSGSGAKLSRFATLVLITDPNPSLKPCLYQPVYACTLFPE